MIDRLKFFHDSMRGGAWPFLVRGASRQVNSDNERDLICLTSSGSLAIICMSAVGTVLSTIWGFLKGQFALSKRKIEAITGQ